MKTGYIKIVQTEGKTPSIEARLVNGNLWMDKYDIAQFFNVFPHKIEMNLRSIFKNRLLTEDEVSYTHRYTDKGIEKQCVFYNLEVLIFLSYRIGTFEAEIFRQFLHSTLREHLQKRETQKNAKLLLWHFCSNQNYLLN